MIFDESSILFPEVSKKFLQPASSYSLSSDWDDKKIQHLQTFKHMCKTSIIYIYIQRVVQLTYKQKKIGVIYSWHPIVFEQILYIILHVLGVYCNIA